MLGTAQIPELLYMVHGLQELVQPVCPDVADPRACRNIRNGVIRPTAAAVLLYHPNH